MDGTYYYPVLPLVDGKGEWTNSLQGITIVLMDLLENDPLETRNIADQHPYITHSLSERLKMWMELQINYYENKKGLIYFFRSEASFLEGKQKLAMLKPVMDNLQILNREELLIKEPTLSGSQSKLFGGIYCPSDESGSCRDFTLSMVDL